MKIASVNKITNDFFLFFQSNDTVQSMKYYFVRKWILLKSWDSILKYFHLYSPYIGRLLLNVWRLLLCVLRLLLHAWKLLLLVWRLLLLVWRPHLLVWRLWRLLLFVWRLLLFARRLLFPRPRTTVDILGLISASNFKVA